MPAPRTPPRAPQVVVHPTPAKKKSKGTTSSVMTSPAREALKAFDAEMQALKDGIKDVPRSNAYEEDDDVIAMDDFSKPSLFDEEAAESDDNEFGNGRRRTSTTASSKKAHMTTIDVSPARRPRRRPH